VNRFQGKDLTGTAVHVTQKRVAVQEQVEQNRFGPLVRGWTELPTRVVQKGRDALAHTVAGVPQRAHRQRGDGAGNQGHCAVHGRDAQG
jgi:hypothetical protein